MHLSERRTPDDDLTQAHAIPDKTATLTSKDLLVPHSNEFCFRDDAFETNSPEIITTP